jgi:hypothetical protein
VTGLQTYAEAVNACYESTAAPYWQDDDKLTHVFIAEIDAVPCFIFKGTIDWQEWVFRDFDAVPVPVTNHPTLGFLHAGFARGALSFLPVALKFITDNSLPAFDISGHSKGAGEGEALAGLLKDAGYAPRKVRLFEPPMVGMPELRSALADLDIVGTQTFNDDGNDLVTEVPPLFVQPVDLLRLKVPNDLSLADKHRMPAVIEALKNADAA